MKHFLQKKFVNKFINFIVENNYSQINYLSIKILTKMINTKSCKNL